MSKESASEIGMISRGEVGLIVAGYGLTHGVIGRDVFSWLAVGITLAASSHQATVPRNWTKPKSTTADFRPMVARLPICRYANACGTGPPRSFARMTLADPLCNGNHS